MPRFAVILPAAGQSSRMQGLQRKKPFTELKGRPVWVRTAEVFLRREDVCQVILVVPPDDLEWFQETFRANLAFMSIQICTGGATRADSVRNGLQQVGSEADFIAVHDAARPLLTTMWVDQIFAAAARHGAAIPGLRITSTVKKVDAQGIIQQTVDRTGLVQAQTPQVFRRELLEQAYEQVQNPELATDEASLLQSCGCPVHVIDGWPQNIKLTTAEDFRLAELLIASVQRKEAGGGLLESLSRLTPDE